MEYFVISAKFVPLKYYTLSSQLRRLASFSVGLFGSANSVTRSYPVMRKSCIPGFLSRFMCLNYNLTIPRVVKNLHNHDTLSNLAAYVGLFSGVPKTD